MDRKQERAERRRKRLKNPKVVLDRLKQHVEGEATLPPKGRLIFPKKIPPEATNFWVVNPGEECPAPTPPSPPETGSS